MISIVENMLLGIGLAILLVACEFIVVKAAVYAFYKGRRLHERDLEKEQEDGKGKGR